MESEGDAGDTYTYCPVPGGTVVRARTPIKVRRLAAGPLVAALEARFGMAAGGGIGRERVGAWTCGWSSRCTPTVRWCAA